MAVKTHSLTPTVLAGKKKKTQTRLLSFGLHSLYRGLAGWVRGYVCSRYQRSGSCLFFSDDEEEIIPQDTDSDVAEQREGGKVKVKWTQEEVIANTFIAWLFFFNLMRSIRKKN